MNYFDLFDLPTAPFVDKGLLAKKYFDLQKKNHPDFFTNATEMEKEDALVLSAAINKAFAIFKDDQKTLEYFLKIKGIIEEEEKYNLPNDFLMEMMDFNEGLPEMGNAAAIQRICQYEESFFNQIKDSIEAYNNNISNEALLKMKEYYYKKKYLNRILDRLVD